MYPVCIGSVFLILICAVGLAPQLLAFGPLSPLTEGLIGQVCKTCVFQPCVLLLSKAQMHTSTIGAGFPC